MSDIYFMTDIVLLTLKDGRLMVVLADREEEPSKGVPTIPGGRILPDIDTDAWAAAARILRKKAGISTPYLEQMFTPNGALRDKRMWSVSIVHYALVPLEVIERSKAVGVSVVPVDDLPELPFDHTDMVKMAVDRLRSKGQYSSLPIFLAGEKFTLTQLQKIYQQVTGEARHRTNFRKKIMELNVLELVRGEKMSSGGKLADVYRLRKEYRKKLAIISRGYGM